MSEVAARVKIQMRALSFGPLEGSMHRWTYHDGSTYAALLFNEGGLVGWACLTKQEEPHPVVGVYVSETERGSGKAKLLLNALLQVYGPPVNTPVYAVAENYKQYPSILEANGYTHLEWE